MPDGAFHKAERVDVFQLGARTQGVAAGRTHGHVGVAAKRAFLQVAIANAQVRDQRVHLAHIGHGFNRAAHVRLTHHFNQWRASAIQVYGAVPWVQVVNGLAGVFFQVCTSQPNDLLTGLTGKNGDPATDHNGVIQLGNLIAFGQVGVKIILARKHGFTADLGPHGQTKAHRVTDGFFVHHRQGARQGRVQPADLAVGFGTIGRRAA